MPNQLAILLPGADLDAEIVGLADAWTAQPAHLAGRHGAPSQDQEGYQQPKGASSQEKKHA